MDDVLFIVLVEVIKEANNRSDFCFVFKYRFRYLLFVGLWVITCSCSYLLLISWQLCCY